MRLTSENLSVIVPKTLFMAVSQQDYEEGVGMLKQYSTQV